ncbi:unnamed protein product [Symbiodinium sp. CCMP2592]|nr:unnamed protein product [Symbiodinium sp. CCMP2592]
MSRELIRSLLMLLIRVMLMAIDGLRVTHSDAPPVRAGPGANAQFLIFAAVNVLLQLFSTLSQGLLAVKWILAGQQVGPPLIACFAIVAADTELLVSAGLAAHLRSVLVKVGIQRGVKIKFACMDHLLGSQVGKTCFFFAAISMAVLIPFLYDKPMKLLAWLGTNFGLLLWANSQFKSIGLMSGEVWEELKPTQTSAEELTVAEFLSQVGLATAEETSWTDRLRCKLNQEDELLLRHRRGLMMQAFPKRTWLCLVHGVLVTCFLLLNAAVPLAMVCYCFAQFPHLQHVSVTGGEIAKFDPKQDHHFVGLQKDWKEAVILSFELELGQASEFRFCWPGGTCCELIPEQRADQVLLTATIEPTSFGTCSLTLFGIRSNEYRFTVLAVTDIHAEVQTETIQKVRFPGYRVHWRHYHADIVRSAGMTDVEMKVAVGVDTSHIRVEPSAYSCHMKTRECRHETVVSRSENALSAQLDLAAASNLTLLLKLLPKDSSAPENTYTVSISVIDILDELDKIGTKMYQLKAEVDSMQDFDTPAAADAQKQLQTLVEKRDSILQQAYDEKPEDRSFDTIQGKLTFLAVGLTGTGKSELCRWMTGNLERCKPSSGTESNTSQVIRVKGWPFDDRKMSPQIEWIDTPGRGDTRGQAKDTELWNETMQDLRDRSAGRIDSIVWVMNAAWQRGTATREMMLKQLRQSFGIHLYPNLRIVLNFLPHSSNRSQYSEELGGQKEKFTRWIMSVEEKIFNWSSKLHDLVEQEVRNLSVYGVSVHPKYYEQKPVGLPLAAPYLSKFPPFSHPAGAEELFSLFNATRARKEQDAEGLDPTNPHPRVGPGILQSAEALCSFCGFREDASHMLLGPAIVGMRMVLHSSSLTEDDGAVLLPSNAECGDPDEKAWPPSWQAHIRRPRNVTNDRLAYLDLPVDQSASEEQRLCYCEAPRCNESWRFGQGSENHFEPAARNCQSPFLRVNPEDFGFRNSWQKFVQFGDLLIGTRASPTTSRRDEFPVLDVNSGKILWGIKFEGLDGDTITTGVSCPGAAVVRDLIYVLPSAGQRLLVIDMASNTTSTIGNSSLLPRNKYHGVLASGEDLYLLPGTGGQVLRMNVVSNSFTTYPIPFKVTSKVLGSWAQAIVESETNKIFALPQEGAEFMLVMRLGNKTFEKVQLGGGYKKKFAYYGLAAVAGQVYVGPGYMQCILIVDAVTEKVVERITTGDFGQHRGRWSWGDAAVAGRNMFFAPLFSTCVLVVNVDTRKQRCMAVPGLMPSGQSFHSAQAIGNKLWLEPYSAKYFLRIDIRVRATTATCDGAPKYVLNLE